MAKAISSPLLLAGPPGWVAYAGVAVVSTAAAGGAVYMASKSDTAAPASTSAQTREKTCDKRPWTVVVHAQGTDCGGTSRSTIGAPPTSSTAAPIPVSGGIATANATFALLTRGQKKIRVLALKEMCRWLERLPPHGYLGKFSFPASGFKDDKRLDIDSYGRSPNFIK